MKVLCPNCKTAGKIRKENIPENGKAVKCPKCSHTFRVRRSAAQPAQTKAQPQEPETINCPKCGTTQPASESCVKCGIVIEKYLKRQASLLSPQPSQETEAMPSEQTPIPSSETEQNPFLKRFGLAIICAIGIAVIFLLLQSPKEETVTTSTSQALESTAKRQETEQAGLEAMNTERAGVIAGQIAYETKAIFVCLAFLIDETFVADKDDIFSLIIRENEESAFPGLLDQLTKAGWQVELAESAASIHRIYGDILDSINSLLLENRQADKSLVAAAVRLSIEEIDRFVAATPVKWLDTSAQLDLQHTREFKAKLKQLLDFRKKLSIDRAQYALHQNVPAPDRLTPGGPEWHRKQELQEAQWVREEARRAERSMREQRERERQKEIAEQKKKLQESAQSKEEESSIRIIKGSDR